ncbi:MAG: PHB depolymerase family esterase [Burkholderiales bacterium]
MRPLTHSPLTNTQRGTIAFAAIAFAVLTASASVFANTPTPLPRLNIDRAQTTVSGISSGGYMAVQLHVAYSGRFSRGVAAIAGGPYNCAENSVLNGVIRCLGKTEIPVDTLVKTTQEWAQEGLIDPLANMSNSRVYVFSGANDSVVKPTTSTSLVSYYQRFVTPANVVHKQDVPAEHGWVSDDSGNACSSKDAPYINNCGFDLAGALLQHLYGTLQPRRAGVLQGRLITFEQTGFIADASKDWGLGERGMAFVPKSCSDGAQCRIHVALHGCKQNLSEVGDAFARNAGFNRWADTNNIVVLYPQTGKGATNGCWDWWGYASKDYAKKNAPQMQAIVAMIDRLSAANTTTAAAGATGK